MTTMSYDLSWKIEKRVIFLRFPEKVTVAQAQDAGEAMNNYFQAGDAPVHFMVDMQRIRFSPIGLQTNLSLANTIVNSKLGWIVTVGGNPMTMLMMGFIAQIKRFKLYQTDSIEAALEFLAKEDESLKVHI